MNEFGSREKNQRCKKTFKQQYLLQRHLKRKNLCKEPIAEVEKSNYMLEKKMNEIDNTKKNIDIKVKNEFNKVITQNMIEKIKKELSELFGFLELMLHQEL